MTGKLPQGVTDHIDRDKLNNRWNNLRDVTTSVNVINSERPQGTLKERYITPRGTKFIVQRARVNEQIWRQFNTLEEAIEYRDTLS